MSGDKADRRNYNVLFAQEIMLGLLNNYGYTLVIAGAQDIARLFEKTNLMPLFTTVMLFAAFATGAIHARIAAPYSYRQRVGLAMLIQSVGYLLFGTAFLFVGVQPVIGFWMAQVATFLVGAFQTIGEINNLSLLNSLPNGLVGAWGFGTGVSQFVGSISYVIAINLGIAYSTFFLSLIPVYLVYWALFTRVEKLARGEREVNEGANEALLVSEESRTSLKLTGKTFPNVLRMGGSVIGNMAATYAFNYLIESGFADRATLHPEPITAAIAVNSYALGVSVYGIGTMLARLSVSWFPTTRIGIITIIQLMNSILWGLEAYYHSIRSLGLLGWWFYQIWMFFVGWIAGMSYSNCLNVISMSKKIPFQYRELVMNVGFIFSNVAVVAATGSSIIMNNTFMSAHQLYPQSAA